MAGGIQKRDHIPVHVHSVSADVLGDAAGFFRSDGGLADGVQQGGLAVVHVAHDHHHGHHTGGKALPVGPEDSPDIFHFRSSFEPFPCCSIYWKMRPSWWDSDSSPRASCCTSV